MHNVIRRPRGRRLAGSPAAALPSPPGDECSNQSGQYDQGLNEGLNQTEGHPQDNNSQQDSEAGAEEPAEEVAHFTSRR